VFSDEPLVVAVLNEALERRRMLSSLKNDGMAAARYPSSARRQ